MTLACHHCVQIIYRSMSLKRGTRVQFIGHKAPDEQGNLPTEVILHSRRCRQLQLLATGTACGGYKGGWVRVNWTNPNGDKVGILSMRSTHLKILEDSGPSRAVQEVMQQCLDLQMADDDEDAEGSEQSDTSTEKSWGSDGNDTEDDEEEDLPELSDDEEVALETALADIREKVHGNTWAFAREMCDSYDENFRMIFSQVEKLQEENAQLKQQLKDLHDRPSGVAAGQEANTANTTPQSADDWRAVFAAGRRECAERCNRRALSAPPTGKRAELEKMAWRPKNWASLDTDLVPKKWAESEVSEVARRVTLNSAESAPPPAKPLKVSISSCSCKEKWQCFCKKPNFWTSRVTQPRQETGVYRDMGGIGQR